MADEAPKVVILDAAGTRHVFPAGFDPVKAAAIVRQQNNPAPASPSAAEMMGMGARTAGGYTTAEEGAPESTTSQTIRGMIHPSPGQQLAMDVLPVAAVAAEAAPDAVSRGMGAVTGAVKSGAQRTADLLRSAATSKVGGKLIKHGLTAAGGVVGGPAGAVIGSSVGEDLASRLQAKPVNVAEPVEAAAEATGPSQKSPQYLANEEALARRRAAYAASQQPVPLKEAVNAVQQLAVTNKVKLTAEEFTAAVKLKATGTPDAKILEGIQAMRQLKAMPGVASTAEANADMAQRAVSGQKSLMPAYGPPAGGNPFRP